VFLCYPHLEDLQNSLVQIGSLSLCYGDCLYVVNGFYELEQRA